VRVTRKKSRFFTVRASAGTTVSVAAGAARDRYGNVNGAGAALSGRSAAGR
jgi:hypothetical protein